MTLPMFSEIEQEKCFKRSYDTINRIIDHEHCIEEIKVGSHFEKIECYAK